MNFKHKLALVFDDDIKTVVWRNYVDYAIWALIALSTIQIFLSTYDSIVAKYGFWLEIVDIFTTICFTIEVSLRIWTIDLVEPKYKGWWGRVKYCFSFYGLIDVLSTYSYYVNFFIPLPVTMLKAIRIARLMKMFRYMKSFRLLANAFASKKSELIVSMQFLVIVTMMLSFILYFSEHDAQPEAYSDGIVSVVWAFMQYIGDPGGFAENSPVTFVGRVIACVIGILGIAIFAVPAGLIGSGFTEAMEKEEKAEKTVANVEKLRLAFERKLDRYTRIQATPQFVSIADIQARLRMSIDDIFDAIDHSDHFRLVNLAATRTVDERAEDKLAVEHFHLNRPYGYMIDRKSNVTIVSPASLVDPCIYHFAYYFAKICGFNYVSRELGALWPYKSFYLLGEDTMEQEGAKEYYDDLNMLTRGNNKVVVTLLAASGANEPVYPTQVHFGYGGKKGDESYDGADLTIKNVPLFDTMYKEMSDRLEKEFSIKCDRQRYHDSASAKIYLRHLENKDNIEGIVIRIAWSECMWNPAHVQISQTMGEVINKYYDNDKPVGTSDELKAKGIGYDGYDK